ncbi:PD40 domain-containing protein [Brumimicrobium mesophilum]|uniref:PD40 domain-containing protein n=1 Tax=Brumimicrobium mesophilum TaxID=392717 RepID=UPI000D144DBF|nr:PD40 domain-containing protein [Brumimicrobium mesophilum]
MKLFFTLVFLSSVFISNANSSEIHQSIAPPDSTSSLIDRTASKLFVEEGKKDFELGRTRDALRSFREAYVRDQFNEKAVYWIGEAHYKMDNFGYALQYARIAEQLNSEENVDLLYLMGRAYHRENKLDSAKLKYERVNELLSSSKKKIYEIQHLMDEVKFADSVSKIDLKYEKILLNAQINSGYDDYNFVISQDGKEAFFVSRRPDTKGAGVNPNDQRYFEDVYYTKWNEADNDWGKASNEIDRLNTEGFDAVNDISADGEEVYLTVNTSVADIRNQTRGSDIMISKRTKEGKWSTPKPIQNSSINTSYFDGAPTITGDGNTMYFVSDRDGEKSKSDIYVSYRNGKSWGPAKKLPMTLNTTGNETTPFVTSDGRFLFFSSDGYTGMGGYDVYVSENNGIVWSKPINLGPEFNTVNNDIFFKFYDKLNKAVVSTYRIQGNKSSMDIFELMLKDWKISTK